MKRDHWALTCQCVFNQTLRGKKGSQPSTLFCVSRTFCLTVFLHIWCSSVSTEEHQSWRRRTEYFLLLKTPDQQSVHLVSTDCDFFYFFFTKHWIITACAPDSASMVWSSPQPSWSTPQRSAGRSSLRWHHCVEVVPTLCCDGDLLPNVG